MKVYEIVVSAGRTFNHPHESFSNLRPQVTLKASLDAGEDFQAAIRELQAKAEAMVEDHKQAMLHSLQELYRLDVQQAEVRGLEAEIMRAQKRLDELRKEHGLVGRELTEGT